MSQEEIETMVVEKSKNIDTSPRQPESDKEALTEKGESTGKFRETFRKFDKDVSPTDNYRRNAILITFNNRPSNLLDPVHVFSCCSL
jgi:hypothetical protein